LRAPNVCQRELCPGKVPWLACRYVSLVYAIDKTTGEAKMIPVGRSRELIRRGIRGI